MVINENDVIIVKTSEYQRQYGNSSYKSEFSHCLRAWRVDSITNNGKINAHDLHGRKKLIHALDKYPCYPHIVRVIHN